MKRMSNFTISFLFVLTICSLIASEERKPRQDDCEKDCISCVTPNCDLKEIEKQLCCISRQLQNCCHELDKSITQCCKKTSGSITACCNRLENDITECCDRIENDITECCDRLEMDITDCCNEIISTITGNCSTFDFLISTSSLNGGTTTIINEGGTYRFVGGNVIITNSPPSGILIDITTGCVLVDLGGQCIDANNMVNIVFNVNNQSNIVIRNGTISNVNQNAIFINNSNNILLQDLVIEHVTGGDSILIQNSTNVKLDNVTIVDNVQNGVTFQNSSDISVTNFTDIISTVAVTNQIGVNVVSSNNVFIDTAKVIHNFNGFVFNNSTDIICNNSVAEDNNNYGYLFIGSSKNIIFNNDTAIHNTVGGYYFNAQNSIIKNSFAINNGNGFFFDQNVINVVMDSTISTTNQVGIFISQFAQFLDFYVSDIINNSVTDIQNNSVTTNISDSRTIQNLIEGSVISVFDQTNFNSSTVTINGPGVYVLDSDVTFNIAGSYAIIINSSDVVLDLGGHTINSGGISLGGIIINNQSNVTIQHGSIINTVGNAIQVNNSSNTTINNITTNNVTTLNTNAIEINNSTNTVIENTNVTNNSGGSCITINNSSNTRIKNVIGFGGSNTGGGFPFGIISIITSTNTSIIDSVLSIIAGFTISSIGISVQGGSELIINNVNITDTLGGIILQNISAVEINNVITSDTKTSGGINIGIGAVNVVVENSISNSSTGPGFYVNSINTVFNNCIAINDAIGFQFDVNAQSAIIKESIAIGNAIGLLINATAQSIQVIDTTINNNTVDIQDNSSSSNITNVNINTVQHMLSSNVVTTFDQSNFITAGQTITVSGTYIVTQDILFTQPGFAITIAASNVILDLGGQTINCNSTSGGVQVNNQSEVTIRNGNIVNTGNNCIQINNCSATTINNINTSNMTSINTSSVVINNSDHTTIENTHVSNENGGSCYTVNNSSNTTTQNSSGCGSNGGGGGGFPLGLFTAIASTATSLIDSALCKLPGAAASLIGLAAQGGSDLLVSGNSIIGTLGGIETNALNRANILNNLISNIGAEGGILFSNASGLIAQENILENLVGPGMKFEVATDLLSLGNKILSPLGDAIIQNLTTNILHSIDQIYSPGGNGFTLTGVVQGIISGCNISGAGAIGISINTGSTGIAVSNSTVNGSIGAGIYSNVSSTTFNICTTINNGGPGFSFDNNANGSIVKESIAIGNAIGLLIGAGAQNIEVVDSTINNNTVNIEDNSTSANITNVNINTVQHMFSSNVVTTFDQSNFTTAGQTITVSGTYVVTQDILFTHPGFAITIAASNVILDLGGQTINCNGTSGGVQVNNQSDVTIRNGDITNTGNSCIQVNNCTNTTINNINTSNMTTNNTDSVVVNNSSHTTIQNTNVTNENGGSCYTVNNSNNTTTQDSSGCGSNGGGGGGFPFGLFKAVTSVATSLVDSVLCKLPGAASSLIGLAGQGGSDLLVSGNKFIGTLGGVVTDGLNRANLLNNLFQDIGAEGGLLFSNASGWLAQDNILENLIGPGMKLQAASDLLSIGNRILSPLGDGIIHSLTTNISHSLDQIFSPGGNGFTLAGVLQGTLSGCTISGAGAIGLSIGTGSSGIAVINSISNGSVGAGMYCNTTNTTFNNCITINNGGAGLSFDNGASNSVVKESTSTGNGTGLLINAGATNIQVVDSTINNNTVDIEDNSTSSNITNVNINTVQHMFSSNVVTTFDQSNFTTAGQTISVPGTYVITQDIMFTHPGFAVTVAAPNVILDLGGQTINCNATGGGVQVNNQSDVTIRNGDITNTANSCIQVNNCTNTTINNINTSNMTTNNTDSVVVNNSSATTIQNTNVNNENGGACYTVNNSNNTTTQDSSGCGSNGGGGGGFPLGLFKAVASTATSLVNSALCTLPGAAGSLIGLAAQGGSGLLASGNKITGTLGGIVTDGLNQANLLNNLLSNIGSEGGLLFSNGSGFLAEGNILEQLAGPGMKLQAASALLSQANKIFGPVGDAFASSGVTDLMHIGDQAIGALGHGFNLGTVTNGILRGCSVLDSGMNGMNLEPVIACCLMVVILRNQH